MGSMGHFQVSSTYSTEFETNEIWVKLRTGQYLETGQVLKKIVRSVFEISKFEIADPIPNMGSMGHFQVSSTYSTEF